MAKKKEDRLSATDEMFDKLRKLYNAACAGAFVLYGNVMDFVTKDHQTLPMELTNMFSKNGKTKKTFIHYDKADGITFTNPSERDAFKTDFAKDLAEYEGQIPTNPELAFRLISKALRGDHLGAGSKAITMGSWSITQRRYSRRLRRGRCKSRTGLCRLPF